jgi:hypothetical protein
MRHEVAMKNFQNSDAEKKIDTLTTIELERLLANAKSPKQQDELADVLLTHDAKQYSPAVNRPDASPA